MRNDHYTDRRFAVTRSAKADRFDNLLKWQLLVRLCRADVRVDLSDKVAETTIGLRGQANRQDVEEAADQRLCIRSRRVENGTPTSRSLALQ